MIRTTLRAALLTTLAIGPAVAQAPATPTPAAPMPGMQGNGMAMQPGMSMPRMKPGMAQGMPMPANHAEMMRQMEVMDKAMMGAPMTGNPDQDFVGMMTPHHQGAIDMARIYLRDGKDLAIRRMAQRIITDQEREIGEFKAWQAKHPVPAG